MKVLIAGGGSVGTFMAQQLSASGHTVTILDNDPAVVNKHTSDHDAVVWMVGDACEVATLAKAGAAEADVVASVTGDDEDNLVVSLLAKQEFAVPRVVGRVNNPKNEWMFNDSWGVDVSVSTPHLLTALVQEAVTEGALVRLMNFEGGATHLVEVTLSSTSPALGKTIEEAKVPREAQVVGIVRAGKVVFMGPDTRLHEHDEVLVLAETTAEGVLSEIFVG
jgi:trk system potassium uptake protein TrkA